MSALANVVGSAGPRILHPRTALLLCDVQEKFRPRMWRFPELISTGSKMLEVAKILDLPVLVSEQYPSGLGQTAAEFKPKLDALDKGKVQIVEKTRFSMDIPPAQKFLESAQPEGVRDVIILGMESHVCVLQTVLDLREKNYNVYVLLDGVSSQNPGEIGPAIECMRSAGAVLTTSESILFQLIKDAKHPQFKQLSSLVKQEASNTSTAVGAFLGPPHGRL